MIQVFPVTAKTHQCECKSFLVLEVMFTVSVRWTYRERIVPAKLEIMKIFCHVENQLSVVGVLEHLEKKDTQISGTICT